MKYSIIVPIYNVENYIAACLDSILCQNYDDYEIIAINDGSTDRSREILNEYKSKTDKLTIISQENGGLGSARNKGIENAEGDYLVFIDSDDYIDCHMLKQINEIIKVYDVDILAFDGYRVTESGEIIDIISSDIYTEEYNDLSHKQFLMLEPTGCTKIYKKKLFIDNSIRFPEKLWYEDLATVFKLSLSAKTLGYYKKSFYYYVQRGESITHSSNVKRMMEIMDAFDEEMNYYKKHGAFEKYYSEIEWNCFLHVLYYSAFRLFMSGYHIKEMKILSEYAKKHFPQINQNEYVLEMSKKRYKMDLIVEQKYFRFYLNTGFITLCLDVLGKVKTIFNKGRERIE